MRAVTLAAVVPGEDCVRSDHTTHGETVMQVEGTGDWGIYAHENHGSGIVELEPGGRFAIWLAALMAYPRTGDQAPPTTVGAAVIGAHIVGADEEVGER